MKKIDILAFGAHPDDIELGCGGTLYKLSQSGYTFGMVDLTEGEMGTRGTVSERYEEAANAAEILNANFRKNLKMEDGNIILDAINKEKVSKIIRTHQPSIVFAPYPNDRHPDHIHASNLITEAAFYSGVSKMPPTELSAHRPLRIIYYMMTYDFTPSFVVDISETFVTKITALKAHQSQFFNPEYEDQETFISSKGYWDALESRAKHIGWKAGVKYAEPFWVREPIVLNDPIPALLHNKM